MKSIKNNWNSKNNVNDFIRKLENQLGIEKTSDWYHVKNSDIISNNGAGLLKKYHNSTFFLAQSIYPFFHFQPFKFKLTPRHYWQDKKNQRYFIIEKLQYYYFSDLYDLTVEKSIEKIGFTLTEKYSNSPIMITTLFPEVIFYPWNFIRVPETFWANDKYALEFLLYCEEYFNMESKNSWYYITHFQIERIGGKALLQLHKGLPNVLKHYFPNENWDTTKLYSKSLTKSQTTLYNLIKNLFPSEKNIQLNYTHPKLVFHLTNKSIQFDIFLPSLNLAFEYQGKQHYEFHSFLGSPNSQQNRDQEKREISLKNNITLIQIPYFWDKTKEGLISIIKDTTPGIL